MNNVLIDPVLTLPEEFEVRREHERYACENTTACFTQFSATTNNEHCTHHARVTDISLNGLAIETSKLVTTGDILSIEVNTENKLTSSTENEVLTAVIMWCKQNEGQNYAAGLRLVSDQTLSSEPANDASHTKTSSAQNQIICPSCEETSFFLREINSDQQTPDIYHCCRCNHSHPITEVMAYNRR